MEQITLRIEVDVNPTESEEKIQKTIMNIFGDIPIQIKQAAKSKRVIAQAKGTANLGNLRNILRRDKIRDAARKALHHGRKKDTSTIYINKQVAYAGHVSFSEAEGESPLGPIKISIESKDLTKLIDWLAPRHTKY